MLYTPLEWWFEVFDPAARSFILLQLKTMLTTTRRRRTRRRFYWAEIGFLILGLIGLKPEIITALLPKSNPSAAASNAPVYMISYPNGTYAIGPSNGNAALQQDWNDRVSHASYYPSFGALSSMPTYSGTSSNDVARSYGMSVGNSGLPPVVWPDKYGPNSNNPIVYSASSPYAAAMPNYGGTYPTATTASYASTNSGATYAANTMAYPQMQHPLQPMHAIATQSGVPTNASATAPYGATVPYGAYAPYASTAQSYPGTVNPSVNPATMNPATGYTTVAQSSAMPIATYPNTATPYGVATYPPAGSQPMTNAYPYATSPYGTVATTPYPAQRPTTTTVPPNSNPWQRYGVPTTAPTGLGRY